MATAIYMYNLINITEYMTHKAIMIQSTVLTMLNRKILTKVHCRNKVAKIFLNAHIKIMANYISVKICHSIKGHPNEV